MADDSRLLAVSQHGNLYRLAAVSVSRRDGSLYLTLIRDKHRRTRWQGELSAGVWNVVRLEHSVQAGDLSISYHGSGLVRYKNVWNASIYGEPLLAITRHFCVIRYSVPSIGSLEAFHPKPGQSLSVFAIPDTFEGRTTFAFFVSPLNDPQVAHGILEINILFEGLLSLNCTIDQERLDLPQELLDATVFMTPTRGLQDSQVLTVETATIMFHKHVTGSDDIVVYEPNANGVYRAYFTVQMRATPKVSIAYIDDRYHAEIVETGTYWMSFRALDKHDNVVKHSLPIRSIELDAEI